MTLRSKVLVALAGAALVVGACSTGTPTGSGATGGGPDGALVKRADIKIEYVTHGQAQDGFWGVVRNGVKAGAADMGVTATYNAPSAESDMPGMVSLIDAAVAKKPTGLVVSIPNPDALGPAIKDGKMDFAIDQQQFLQGYLPIVILTNYAETKNLPTGNGEGLIMTGPGFVTQKDAADVIALAAKGLR